MKNQGVEQKIRRFRTISLLLVSLGYISICGAVTQASTASPAKSVPTVTKATPKNNKVTVSDKTKLAATDDNAKKTESSTETKSETTDESADSTSQDPEIAADDTSKTTDDSTIVDDRQPTVEKDPYEGFNRAMFTFNDKLDIYFLKPIATVYNKVVPKPLNKGIHNVFENINTVPTIADDILQANFYQASNDFWRLAINTTVGIGGLFDVAERMNLEPYQNDFGLTLARWGYTDSNYLVLPFFGPNTLRDGLIGLPVDYFAFSVYPYMEPPSLRYQIYSLGVIDRRAQLLKFQDVVDEASYDKYVFVRNAYLQRRAYQIEQNNHRSCCDRMADAKATVTVDAQATDTATTAAVTPLSAPAENYD